MRLYMIQSVTGGAAPGEIGVDSFAPIAGGWRTQAVGPETSQGGAEGSGYPWRSAVQRLIRSASPASGE